MACLFGIVHNSELLEPDSKAEVSSAFLQLAPSTVNASHDSDPDGFTSCNNLFQLIDLKLQEIINGTTTLGEVNQIAPPVPECLLDPNLPGRLYERMATTGGLIEMGGTTVVLAHKQEVMAENLTEAEIVAAAYLGKNSRWLVLFMSDLGLPFPGPMPIAEDNAATRIIAHLGKISASGFGQE
jgi:hypothetical protein